MKFVLTTLILLLGLAPLSFADPAQIIKDGVVYDPPAGYEARWVPANTRLNYFVATELDVVKTLRPSNDGAVQSPPTNCRGDDELVAGPVPPCK